MPLIPSVLAVCCIPSRILANPYQAQTHSLVTWILHSRRLVAPPPATEFFCDLKLCFCPIYVWPKLVDIRTKSPESVKEWRRSFLMLLTLTRSRGSSADMIFDEWSVYSDYYDAGKFNDDQQNPFKQASQEKKNAVRVDSVYPRRNTTPPGLLSTFVGLIYQYTPC